MHAMGRGEDDFVAWLASEFGSRARAVPIGLGDDMAMVRLGRRGAAETGLVLVTADMLMDGVDFQTALHSPRLIGRKAMAASLSDCAAMAVRPRFALASVALPESWPVRNARRLCSGVEAMGRAYGCVLIGGDTNSWRHPLVIDVVVLAEPWPDVAPVRRSGVRAGDIICVTGQLGGSLWEGKRRDTKTPKHRRDAKAAIQGRRGAVRPGVPHHLVFEPRVTEAHWLAARLGRGLHAMMDLSDGLSTDAARMARASGCGIEFDAAALEIVASSAARAASQEDGRAVLDHVLNDGEDFELLFAAAPKAWRRLPTAEPRGRVVDSIPVGVGGSCGGDVAWTVIGVAIDEKGIWLRRPGGGRQRIESRGWQHSIGS